MGLINKILKSFSKEKKLNEFEYFVQTVNNILKIEESDLVYYLGWDDNSYNENFTKTTEILSYLSNKKGNIKGDNFKYYIVDKGNILHLVIILDYYDIWTPQKIELIKDIELDNSIPDNYRIFPPLGVE